MSEAITVAVVDDQAVIRAGLKLIVDNESDMTVVAEAANGADAIGLISEVRPDVVLMDIRMAELDGIAATRTLTRRAGGTTAVLVLTTFDDDEYLFESLRAGAAGFLLKDAKPEVLLDAIRSVAAGDTVVDSSVTRTLVNRWANLEEAQPGPGLTPDQLALTERETNVLEELARGKTNREIATSLYLSEATIKTHVSNLLAKLGVHSRVQAVILAYEYGVVRIGEEAE